jgi:hypothetical protein
LIPFNTRFILAAFLLYVPYSVVAQKRINEWQLGYLAPYLTNTGVTAGWAFDLKEFGKNSIEQRKTVNRLQLLTQLGYFTQINVSKNIFLNPEMVYKWKKLDKRFFLTSSFGAGYLRSFQRQDGTLNLATGELDYRNEILNYFLPNLNVGFGLDAKKHLGFYLKSTYGRKVSMQNANAAFWAISTGLIVKINSKD